MEFTKERLGTVARLLGGKRLSAIMGNYCRDYKQWNHGMADLVLWNSSDGRIKWSEVKSENDRLSDVQKSWIVFMSKNNIDVEVCYVNRDYVKGQPVFTDLIH